MKFQEIPDNHPIINALKTGDVDVVKHYLESGISPHTLGLVDGALGSGNIDIVQAFLDHGLDLSLPINIHGETPLFRSIEKKNLTILMLLIENGADIQGRPMGGGTALHKAASIWPEGAAFLLQSGSDVHAKATDRRTAMMSAAFSNQIRSLEVLLSAGARLEDRDDEGNTPLILAARAGKVEATAWLIEHGADIHAKAERGKTALDWAKSNGHQMVSELLQARMVE